MKEILRIIRFSGSLWKYYLAVSICVIAISLLNLVQPLLIKGIIDLLVAKDAGQNVQLEQLLIRVGIILIAVLLVTPTSNINGYVGDMLVVRLNSLLSQRYFDHLLRLPIEYYDNEMTGKITARLERSSISTISQMIQTLANNFVQFFLTTIVILIVVSIYSWQVAVLLITLAEQAQWPLLSSSFVIDGIQRARAGSIDYFKVKEAYANRLVPSRRILATDCVVTAKLSWFELPWRPMPMTLSKN